MTRHNFTPTLHTLPRPPCVDTYPKQRRKWLFESLYTEPNPLPPSHPIVLPTSPSSASLLYFTYDGRKSTTRSWTPAPDPLARTTAFGEWIPLPWRLPRQVHRLPFCTFSTKLTRIQVHRSRCLLPDCTGSAWQSLLVFESPVWSGFLMPKGFNRNRNRSAFFLEVKKPDRTAKNRGLRSFCGP